MKKTAQTKNLWFPRLTTPLLTLLCLSTFSLIAASPIFAADDAYLSALEGESGSSSASSKSGDSYLDALSDEAESSSKVQSGEKHDEAYYENQKKMVETLRLERPATYKFYTKLTPKDKARVFEKYSTDEAETDDDRLSHLQKFIMDLYFKK